MTTEAEIPTCYACGRTWPEIGVDEPVFRICGECFHVYPTELDLIEADFQVIDQISPSTPTRRRVEEIWSCPCCAHDF